MSQSFSFFTLWAWPLSCSKKMLINHLHIALKRLASNFSFQYHPYIKYKGHDIEGNDHQFM